MSCPLTTPRVSSIPLPQGHFHTPFPFQPARSPVPTAPPIWVPTDCTSFEMSPNSHHPQHFHLPNHHLQQLQLQHQHQQHQQQLQIHQQQQQQQQQQRSAAVNGNAPNATSSPVMNFLPTAATIPTASAPSSSSSTPAASGPEDIERPQKRQRTSASNLSLAPRLPLPRLPPPSANVAPPPVNVPPPAPRSTLQHKQQHRQISHQKATAPPPLKPAPLSTASPLASPAVSSSVPFMRVQEQGSTETFALPLAAVQSWEVCLPSNFPSWLRV